MGPMIKRICNKIAGLIKVSTVKSVDDSGVYRLGSAASLGKTQTVNVISLYGHIMHPPANSMGVTFISQGQESTSFVIADDPKNRIKDLAEGEVGIANYSTGTHFIMKSSGDWDIQVNGNVNLTSTGDLNATVGGDMVSNVTGNVTTTAGGNIALNAASGQISLNAPSIIFPNGSIDSSGFNLNNASITVTSGDVTADGISLKNHVHTGVTTGGSNTGGPV